VQSAPDDPGACQRHQPGRQCTLQGLARRPGQVATAQQVKVKMPDGLAARGVAVVDQPKAVLGDPEIMGHPPRHLEDVADQGIVRRGQVDRGADVLAGDDQHVIGGLRVEVLDHHHLIVAIDHAGRNLSGRDLTEDACASFVWHGQAFSGVSGCIL